MIANVVLKVEAPDDVAARLWQPGEWDWEAMVSRSFAGGDSRAAYELIITVEDATHEGAGLVKSDDDRQADAESRAARRHQRDTYRDWDRQELTDERGDCA